MSRLALYLLGPPRLELDGEPVRIARHKVMALLAYLAVTGQSHSRDTLATLLWPEYDQSRARANLRHTLWVLNRTLGGEGLAADRETAGLNPDADLWLDVREFRQKLTACETHGHPATEACSDCLSLLEEAVALCRDDFMAGFTLRDSAPFDEWQLFQSEGLRDELAGALERLVRCHSAEGECELAIGYARRWLALDPLHEPTHRHLMQLYAQAGQRAAALRQYQQCVRILEEELGLPPAEETTSLYEQIRTEAADLDEPLFPVSLPRHNLPVQSTPFVGREAVLAEINGRLDDPACRLLTLVGPGGSGKTRLALEAAADILSEAQLDSYPHGVYFVSLAPLDSAEAIVPTVAQAVGFSFYTEAETSAQQQLLDYLRPKGMLLIMDSFEHLLEGTGLVTEILRAALGVKILATSRARLNVGGEHRFRIAGMDYPDEETTSAVLEAHAQQREEPVPMVGEAHHDGLPKDVAQYSAVKLFLQGARRAQPGFELTDENLNGVIQVCRLVAGMPLGIRLAAAWVELLTPAEIAAEIGRSLDFLETGRRDVPGRQRSMRAAFDHSWKLLPEQEREVFQKLSVFRGGFTRAAAQEITGASLRTLLALLDKSFLDHTPGPATESTLNGVEGLKTPGRYGVHELLRQYAAEKLDRSPTGDEAVRDRHCAYYAAALQAWAADLKGPRQQAALMEIEADGENARAAWNWAAERGQVERLEQGMEGLGLFYKWRGRYREGEAACRAAEEKLMATAPGEGPVPSSSTTDVPSTDRMSAVERLRALAKVMAWRGLFGFGLGRVELAGQLWRQSLDLLEGPELADQDTRLARAFVLEQMGRMAEFSNREYARQSFEQSLALYRSLGDRWGTAAVMERLGMVAFNFGKYDEARPLYEESLAIRRALGDRMGIAIQLLVLGLVAGQTGQLEEAERSLRESIAMCQEMGDPVNVADGLLTLAWILMYSGRFTEAHRLLEESAARYNDLGMRGQIATLNWSLGWVSMDLGLYEQARTQTEIGCSIFPEVGDQHGVAACHLSLGRLALVREAYAEARQLLERSVTLYREIGQQYELCWALATLGNAVRALGQLSQAQRHTCEALRRAAETGAFASAVKSLAHSALLLADQGEPERAVELYALASRYPMVGNSRYWEDVVGRHIAAILPPEVVTAAQERGRARDLEATVAELLVELGEEQGGS